MKICMNICKQGDISHLNWAKLKLICNRILKWQRVEKYNTLQLNHTGMTNPEFTLQIGHALKFKERKELNLEKLFLIISLLAKEYQTFNQTRWNSLERLTSPLFSHQMTCAIFWCTLSKKDDCSSLEIRYTKLSILRAPKFHKINEDQKYAINTIWEFVRN